ncbi:WRKY transcription factor 44 [Vitis vinifera]|uniref:WRKY transcription factor 44 n=1 Tax=Vitis vinifera TaxID=29760 RepID=A0A438DW84_VITVI|nr:WRKY transcription factor 44 [Vitis vinifera]
MEIKESERIVVAKPVASRPTCSSFRSFSELLAGAINASPPTPCPETSFAAIRPKTVRFKPVANRAPIGVVSSQAQVSGTEVCNSSDKVLKSDSKPTVVYKPLAKLVSKTTVSLLANLGSSNMSHQQTLAQVEARVQPPNQDRQHSRPHLSSNLHQTFPSQEETDRTSEPSKTASQNLEEDQNLCCPQAMGTDLPMMDIIGENMAKSKSKEIAEIVYKGEHNHSKPQPPKRNSSGTLGQGFVSDGTGQDTNNPAWGTRLNERNEGSEGRIENQNEVGLSTHSTYPGKAPLNYDSGTTGALKAGGGTPDNSCGLSGDCEEGSKGLEPEEDEPRSKRRKSENQSSETVIVGEGAQEPRIVVQNSTDSEILGDGFRWRKYGQKVVKGNSYPRSYYRCTSLKCNVRKHVERASEDPGSFITTYEGKHNHDMPTRNTNAATSEPDMQAHTNKEKP